MQITPDRPPYLPNCGGRERVAMHDANLPVAQEWQKVFALSSRRCNNHPWAPVTKQPQGVASTSKGEQHATLPVSSTPCQ